MSDKKNIAVIGAGPGGYAAAFLAADLGMKVTLIDRDSNPGGVCLYVGCIPSKALLHVARVIAEVDELRHDWGVEYSPPKLEINKIRERKEKVITTLTGGLKQIAKRRNVKVITARGVFENSTTLKLEGDDPSIPAERQSGVPRPARQPGQGARLPHRAGRDRGGARGA